jgi:hypothetical protein
VLVPSAELSALHGVLRDALGAVAAQFDDPEYTGPGYRPHVTVTRTARMQPGEVALLEQVALVDMEPLGPQRWRQVLWVSGFSAPG